MGWNQEDVMQLIDSYKRCELIWNPNHPLYFSKVNRQDAWRQVAKEMGRPVEECKKKMDCLLSALRRETMKIRRSIGTGKRANEVYKSSWFAFDSLSFILDKKKSKQMDSNIKNENGTAESEDDEMPQIQEASENVVKFLSPSTPGRNRQEDDQHTFQLLTSPSNQLSDECEHFGNMIASKLRNYDEVMKCAIQNEIMGVFLKANRGLYNHYYPAQPNNSPEANSSFSSQVYSANVNSPRQRNRKFQTGNRNKILDKIRMYQFLTRRSRQSKLNDLNEDEGRNVQVDINESYL